MPDPEALAQFERVTFEIDQMEATVEANLKRAAALRQAVLRMAFSGRLASTTPVHGR